MGAVVNSPVFNIRLAIGCAVNHAPGIFFTLLAGCTLRFDKFQTGRLECRQRRIGDVVAVVGVYGLVSRAMKDDGGNDGRGTTFGTGTHGGECRHHILRSARCQTGMHADRGKYVWVQA